MIKFFLFILFFVLGCYGKELVEVVKVPGNVLGISPFSKAWMSADFVKLKLYPYFLVPSNDKEVNSLNRDLKIKEISVKILSDGIHIAFLFKWEDTTIDFYNTDDIDKFYDGFSVSFAKEDSSHPYVHEGSENRGVVTYVKKAKIKSMFLTDIGQEYGDFFGKNLETWKENIFFKQLLPGKKIILEDILIHARSMDMVYKNGYWLASLTKNLDDSDLILNRNIFAMYIGVWNGSKFQRGSIKSITPWFLVKLNRKEDDLQDSYKNEFKNANGDISKGKKLTDENCAMCHRYRDKNEAPLFMAPNLSFIGGYASYGYILESLLKPSKVIKRRYLRRTHPNFLWYEISKSGETVSTMPSFDWMSDKDIEDIISYLQTLKGISKNLHSP